VAPCQRSRDGRQLALAGHTLPVHPAREPFLSSGTGAAGGTLPTEAERAHLVGFCLRGLTRHRAAVDIDGAAAS